MLVPSNDEFARGCQQYAAHETRDSMYKVATFLVSHFWGRPADMADGMGVLLLTWNQAFYRYGPFSYDSLERCIVDNFPQIQSFRKRDILSLSDPDHPHIKALFLTFLRALEIDQGKSKGKQSPVAASKALHLLAPGFFPLWDARIAEAHGCRYQAKPAEKYLAFCLATQAMARRLKDIVHSSDRTLVKLIDEYNYSKYTQGWL
jgi:hypothetical protein